MWAYNVCIWMTFVPLYKGVILIYKVNVQLDKANVLTVQDKCSNYTNGIQGYHLWKISINFGQLFFFFVLSSKDYTLSRYTLYHTLILCILFNSHMTIQILIPLMMFESKFCFSIFHYFLNQTNENMVNLPIVTHWVRDLWNLGHSIRYLY